jgi:hypothetical protein
MIVCDKRIKGKVKMFEHTKQLKYLLRHMSHWQIKVKETSTFPFPVPFPKS